MGHSFAVFNLIRSPSLAKIYPYLESLIPFDVVTPVQPRKHLRLIMSRNRGTTIIITKRGKKRSRSKGVPRCQYLNKIYIWNFTTQPQLSMIIFGYFPKFYHLSRGVPPFLPLLNVILPICPFQEPHYNVPPSRSPLI